MTKLPKQAVLYVHRNADYKCSECLMFIPEKERCFIHSDVTEIKPYGTCGYWAKGKPYPGLEPMGSVSKVESGYVEHKPGYSCGRCEYFSAEKQDCQVVDKDTPGDDPGKITAQGCCANWEQK